MGEPHSIVHQALYLSESIILPKSIRAHKCIQHSCRIQDQQTELKHMYMQESSKTIVFATASKWIKYLEAKEIQDINTEKHNTLWWKLRRLNKWGDICIHRLEELMLLTWASLWLSGKESTCQCRRCGFSPWITATHSSILSWEIPWTEEPGRLQSMRLQWVWQDLESKPSVQFSSV